MIGRNTVPARGAGRSTKRRNTAEGAALVDRPFALSYRPLPQVSDRYIRSVSCVAKPIRSYTVTAALLSASTYSIAVGSP